LVANARRNTRRHIEGFKADQLVHGSHASEHHWANFQAWQVQAIL
jgi:hypothetical protein